MQPSNEPLLQSEEDDGSWCHCKERKGCDMVACDSKSCTITWFRLECVNLSAVPRGNCSVQHAVLTCTGIRQKKEEYLMLAHNSYTT